MAGPAHGDGVCEDASDIKVIGGRVVCVLADGLGSAPCGGEGASLAVSAAIDAAETADQLLGPDDVVWHMAIAARRALENAPGTLKDYACTFIACVAEEESIATAHIGDGAIVGRSPEGELAVVSSPGESEYVNEVVHIAQDRWLSSLRMSIHEPIAGFMAFTDGLQRAALNRSDDSWAAFSGFIEPLFAHAERSESADRLREELVTLLCGPRLSEHSEDDKSLAIGLLPQRSYAARPVAE